MGNIQKRNNKLKKLSKHKLVIIIGVTFSSLAILTHLMTMPSVSSKPKIVPDSNEFHADQTGDQTSNNNIPIKKENVVVYPEKSANPEKPNKTIISSETPLEKKNNLEMTTKFSISEEILGTSEEVTSEIPETATEFIKDTRNHNIEDFSILFFGIKHSRLLLGYEDCCGKSFPLGTRVTLGNMSDPIVAKESNSSSRPIVSVGRHGRGRFVYTPFVITPADASEYDNDELVGNIIKWVITHSFEENIGIGLCVNSAEMEMFYRSIRHKAEEGYYTYSNISNCSSNKTLEDLLYLKKFKLLILNDHNVKTEKEIETLRKFVYDGGRLILGSSPWNYNTNQISFANKLLKALGDVSIIINGEIKPFEVTKNSLGKTQIRCKHPSPMFNNLLRITKQENMNLLC